MGLTPASPFHTEVNREGERGIGGGGLTVEVEKDKKTAMERILNRECKPMLFRPDEIVQGEA